MVDWEIIGMQQHDKRVSVVRMDLDGIRAVFLVWKTGDPASVLVLGEARLAEKQEAGWGDPHTAH